MSPLVGWPSVLGLSAFTAGLYMYWGDLCAPGIRGQLRLRALAPVFIASAWRRLQANISRKLANSHSWFRSGCRCACRSRTWWASVCLYEAQRARRSGRSALALRLWSAVVALFFGLQNILYPQFAPGVPSQQPTSAWVPLPHVAAYLTGAILVAMGGAMLARKTAAAAITAVGVLMSALTIGLFVPDLFLAEGVSQRVLAINFVADTLLFAGMMLAIAREVAAELSVDDSHSRPSPMAISHRH